ncbi:MAG: transcription termination factor NusA [Candidatus Buchananbacteria bacterium]|jgi:N utilization substance protein A
MSQSPIQAAIQQICQEKNLDEDVVLRSIEVALAAAYRKDFGNKMQNIITEFDPKTGETKVFDVKTVVEDLPPEPELDEEGNPIMVEEAAPAAATTEEKTEKKQRKPKEEAGSSFAAAFAAAIKAKKEEEEGITTGEKVPVTKAFIAEEAEGIPAEGEEERKFNPKTEIELKEALLVKPDAKLNDEIVTPLELPGEFGRMAAQTAKQVIIQKLREEERIKVFEEFKSLEHTLITGTVQRREGRNVLVDLGHTTAILPPEEQVERERYNTGNRMKFYLKTVELGMRGSNLVVSRTTTDLVKAIFEEEIPEIASNAIEIKSIAREAGSRTKVAITSHEENIDPIGSCVGQRGSRIQTIISELSGEKVDIILWDADPAKFITNSLSPAKVTSVAVDEPAHLARVMVKDDQLSLAIGRGGQNVRLASRLTGWKIDIISDGTKTEVVTEEVAPAVAEKIIAEELDAETPAETAEAVEEKPAKEKKPKKAKKEKIEEVETPEEETLEQVTEEIAKTE